LEKCERSERGFRDDVQLFAQPGRRGHVTSKPNHLGPRPVGRALGLKMLQPSVRAATWRAAQCVRWFVAQRNAAHPALAEFCAHLERLSVSECVPEWNEEANRLAITGLGSPLPRALAEVPDLAPLVEAAREVSASQIFGAWDPGEIARLLSECAVLAGLEPGRILARAAELQTADQHGWGHPVVASELVGWSLEA